MSRDIKIELKENVIIDINQVNDLTKKMTIITEDNIKEEIEFKVNSDIDRFINAVYVENFIGQIIYKIYDESNFLGYAGKGKVLLLKNSVNYGYIEQGLTLNQTYLHDLYRLPEYAFILLVGQELKNSRHILRRG